MAEYYQLHELYNSSFYTYAYMFIPNVKLNTIYRTTWIVLLRCGYFPYTGIESSPTPLK